MTPLQFHLNSPQLASCRRTGLASSTFQPYRMRTRSSRRRVECHRCALLRLWQLRHSNGGGLPQEAARAAAHCDVRLCRRCSAHACADQNLLSSDSNHISCCHQQHICAVSCARMTASTMSPCTFTACMPECDLIVMRQGYVETRTIRSLFDVFKGCMLRPPSGIEKRQLRRCTQHAAVVLRVLQLPVFHARALLTTCLFDRPPVHASCKLAFAGPPVAGVFGALEAALQRSGAAVHSVKLWCRPPKVAFANL